MPLILPTPEQPEISPLQKAKQECKSEQGMGGAHAKLGNGMEQKGVAAEKAINTTGWGEGRDDFSLCVAFQSGFGAERHSIEKFQI